MLGDQEFESDLDWSSNLVRKRNVVDFSSIYTHVGTRVNCKTNRENILRLLERDTVRKRERRGAGYKLETLGGLVDSLYTAFWFLE